jgi:hypothetical protein
MDFLLDNSRFVRIKWLGRQSALSGKSMYLRKTVPELNHPARPFVKTEGTARAALRSGLFRPVAERQDH